MVKRIRRTRTPPPDLTALTTSDRLSIWSPDGITAQTVKFIRYSKRGDKLSISRLRFGKWSAPKFISRDDVIFVYGQHKEDKNG